MATYFGSLVHIQRNALNMKKKRLTAFLALLISATTFGACMNTDKHTAFSHYWFQDVDLPTDSVETLTYDVSFESGSGLSGYEVDYEGTYVMTLHTDTAEKTFRLETELITNATYSYKGESVTLENDTVTSWAEFALDKSLTPIASHKEIKGYSPVTGSVATVEDCYEEVNYTIDTTYEADGKSGKCVTVNNINETTQTQSFEADEDYTPIDNEYLLLALRGINPSSYVAPTLSVYAPFTAANQLVDVKVGSKEEGTSFTFTRNDEEAKERVINYYPLTLSIQSSMPGQSQTVWVAETGNAKSNNYRNVILQMEIPVSYNLGTLVYKLTSAQFA